MCVNVCVCGGGYVCGGYVCIVFVFVLFIFAYNYIAALRIHVFYL